ncbi:hypothetical protein RUM43_014794 [Polyplax serrata]|uniref:Uncharacterized protein n=1 Tax=Polyplax serrata TaxID=468196 RepID=A0AAN8S6Q5_POLSC
MDHSKDSSGSSSTTGTEATWGYSSSGYPTYTSPTGYNYSNDFPSLESSTSSISHVPAVLPEHTPGSSMQQTGDYYGSMKPDTDMLPCGNNIVQTGSNSSNVAGSGGTVVPTQLRYDGGYPSGSCQSSYHAGWNANNYQSYPNYYNSSSGTASQTPYLNPTPSVVLYPHLYSTVNQNQIHLHLHGEKAAESLQCSGEELAATIVANTNNVTISSGTRNSIEIGIVHNNQGSLLSEEDRYTHSDRQGDQSVWRPY